MRGIAAISYHSAKGNVQQSRNLQAYLSLKPVEKIRRFILLNYYYYYCYYLLLSLLLLLLFLLLSVLMLISGKNMPQ